MCHLIIGFVMAPLPIVADQLYILFNYNSRFILHSPNPVRLIMVAKCVTNITVLTRFLLEEISFNENAHKTHGSIKANLGQVRRSMPRIWVKSLYRKMLSEKKTIGPCNSQENCFLPEAVKAVVGSAKGFFKFISSYFIILTSKNHLAAPAHSSRVMMRQMRIGSKAGFPCRDSNCHEPLQKIFRIRCEQ